MAKRRVAWIDIYKALCITMVVLGHAASPFNVFIYMFHIPAFFFISGFTFSTENKKLQRIFINKAKRLLLPFAFANALFYSFHYGTQKAGISQLFYSPEQDAPLSPYSIFNSIASLTGADPLGGATWFLVTLFFVSLFIGLLLVLPKYVKVKPKVFHFFLITAVLYVISFYFFYMHYPRSVLVYNLDLLPISASYFLFGYACKEAWSVRRRSLKLLYSAGVLSFLVLICFLEFKPTPINFPTRSFADWRFTWIPTFAGITLLFSVSQLLEANKYVRVFLVYLGQRTLPILLFHFVGFKVAFISLSLLQQVEQIEVSMLVPPQGTAYWGLITAFGIILSLAIGELLFQGKKYLTLRFQESGPV